MEKLNSLYMEMIHYYKNVPKEIQHFAKVHSYSKLIGELENIDAETLFILETAAFCHDIGIKKSREVYGNSEGKHQEELGPDIAKEMLGRLGFEEKVIERVCYLIGHHHTYKNIDGLDYQILVEADFLVNIYEEQSSREAAENVYQNIFKTESGKKICREMFLAE